MNVAAWIALVSAVVLLLTNVVLLTRFFSSLERLIEAERLKREGEFGLIRAEVEGSLNVIRVEHKSLVESTNADNGRIQTQHQKFERRMDARLRDVERITGKAKMFNAPEDD
jgi:hypothetical protein